jgi:hypothetical protein
MKWYKITFQCCDQHGWRIAYKTLKADSVDEAKRLADMWPPLILKVEEI